LIWLLPLLVLIILGEEGFGVSPFLVTLILLALFLAKARSDNSMAASSRTLVRFAASSHDQCGSVGFAIFLAFFAWPGLMMWAFIVFFIAGTGEYPGGE
jgi:hypothetical protein